MSASERDREFAEKLARSMGEGWGRHNSARDFRRRLAGMGHFAQVGRYLSRVIGRYGNHHIRECWQDCAVGDVFLVGDDPYKSHDYRAFRGRRNSSEGWNDVPGLEPHEEWMFERVRVTVTGDDGRTWREEEFWRRIE